jgi:hypothetical protein
LTQLVYYPAPAFSFNPPKKDEGLFSKPVTTNLFTPLNTNNKRENTGKNERIKKRE